MLLYIGTYSTRGSKGIYVYRLDTTSGALTPVGVAAGSPNNPSFLALHPNGKSLYAVGESSGAGDGGGPVVSFAVDPATGIPGLRNQQSSRGTGPCFLSLDREGKCALVANYGGGSVAILPIGLEGQLLPAPAAIPLRGTLGPRKDRQDAPHGHAIQVDRDNRFAIAADLGQDRLFVYRFDAAKATLTPNDPAGIATRPGAGPRHLAFHPTAPYVFVINELDSTLTSYRYAAAQGALTEIQTISTVPDQAAGSNFPAEICVHPSGRFIYGSNRGRDSIVAFAVDPASGRLRLIGHFPTRGKNPRHFAIDPSGEFLIAANQDSDNLVVFRIQSSTGNLAPTGATADIPSPVCVCFAPGT